jgi:hypothetical protein
VLLVLIPDRSRRYTDEEVRRLYWERPAAGRLPHPGDVVMYRHAAFADPWVAEVARVELSDMDDPNVYDDRGKVRYDPAPIVVLTIVPPPGADRAALPSDLRHALAAGVSCREARLPLSAGWTWPDQTGTTTAGVA